jgi:hypothetical protein
MHRVAVIAKLRPGAAEHAERLIEHGPPFDPSKHGIERHGVFLASDAAVFVFEGGEPRTLLAALSGSDEQSALAAWEPLIDGTPMVARQMYDWVSPDRARQDSWGE